VTKKKMGTKAKPGPKVSNGDPVRVEFALELLEHDDKLTDSAALREACVLFPYGLKATRLSEILRNIPDGTKSSNHKQFNSEIREHLPSEVDRLHKRLNRHRKVFRL